MITCPCSRIAVKKHHQVAFLDPEDGNVEVTNVKESEDAIDNDEEAEQKEEAPGTDAGEESKEAAISDNENITMSTFGHTKDEDGGDKQESEKKSAEETETTKVFPL